MIAAKQKRPAEEQLEDYDCEDRSYNLWQKETFGNILPVFKTLDMPDNNTWAERNAELQLMKDELIK